MNEFRQILNNKGLNTNVLKEIAEEDENISLANDIQNQVTNKVGPKQSLKKKIITP